VDFFQRQDDARARTRALVCFFVAATAGTVLAVGLLTGVVLGIGGLKPAEISAAQGWACAITLVIVLGGALWRSMTLGAGGGRQIAESLGGTEVGHDPDDRLARRLVDVVQEMALASGTPVPAIYILEREEGINAFAAGWTPQTAVVAVTRGALERLDRDELQGVVAHEFSHILNGDMRLALRLMALLHGLLVLVILGRMLLRAGSVSSSRRNKNGGQIALLGLAVIVVGGIGWFMGQLVKAAISRSREHLADAAAVQFTRHPKGLAGALKKIGAGSHLGYIRSDQAEEASHLFLVRGVRASWFGWFATHPPIEQRIRAIEPGWDGTWPPAPQIGRVGTLVPPPEPAVRRMDPNALALAAAIPAASRFHERVAAVDPATLDASHTVLARIDDDLRRDIEEPFTARAVAIAACADPDPARATLQFDLLDKALDDSSADRQLLADCRRLHARLSRLGPAAPATAIQLAAPALRRMVPAQRARFAGLLLVVVRADGRLSVREIALLRCCLVVLGRAKPQASRLADDGGAAAQIIAAIASLGGTTTAAYATGMARLDLPAKAPPDIDADHLLRAFDRVAGLVPEEQSRFLDACAWTAAHDGRLTVAEAELVRAVAISVGLPMPFFAGGLR
jgi:Zn-dependent protease with chaperone function